MKNPVSFPGSWWRIIGLAAALAFLPGCTAIKLAYNNSPEVLYWWLDGYLDFTPAQTPRVKEDLTRLQAWHRANELPRYIDLLRKVERMAPANTTPDQVCAVFGEARERWHAIAEHAEPTAASLALAVESGQLPNLERKYAKVNAEYRKDWLSLSAKEQHDKRFKDILKRSEMFYGKLDEPQRAAIRAHVEKSSFDPKVSNTERLRRQQDALQVLRKVVHDKPPAAEVRTMMRGYLQRSMDSPDPAYRAYQHALVKEGCASFAAAHNATTPEQRAKAVKKLQDYQRDLSELSSGQ
ncbi:MAG: DUF6279 family lipoprotein [Burkholderiaceae bacterium]